jgi:NitT/TauT family transport system permease protein
MKREIIGPLIVIMLWILITELKFVSPLLLPSPFAIIITLIKSFIKEKIYLDFLFTIYRTFAGLFLGAISGIPLGIVIGYYRKIYQMVEVIIDFFRSLPAFTLIPLFLIAFGITEKAKIALAGWAVFFVVLINTTYGVGNVKQARIAVGRVLKMNALQLFVKIIFFDALPNIIAGLRVGISFSLVVTVVAEMLMGAKFGLGKFIYESGLMYNMLEMYVGILLVGMLGYFLNKIFILVEIKIFHWGGK